MARKLYANYFLWQRNDISLKVVQGQAETDLTLFLQQPPGVAAPESKGSSMATDGKFVGMIVYVPINTQTVSTVHFRVQALEFPFSGSWKILGGVDVPPGEIGCFYSDPDTSDGTRDYLQYAVVKVTVEAEPGSLNPANAVENVSMMIGFDVGLG